MSQADNYCASRILLAASALALLGAGAARAQDDPPMLEIYGFAEADYIQDFNRVDPDWDATLRPSKIPTTQGTFGDNGQSIFSVRQTRFGIKGHQEVGG